MATCMFCEDYQPARGDAIPRCFISGGYCHGFENGCSCMDCTTRGESAGCIGGAPRRTIGADLQKDDPSAGEKGKTVWTHN